MKSTKGAILVFALLFAVAVHTFGQDAPQFTQVTVTDEGAIRLAWTSTNSEVYQIQYANELNGNEEGSTAWRVLYDEYPSHGTNTFWLDTGNYIFAPQILHPKKMAMRFYRILDKGPDTTSTEPTVSINSPTNDAAVSGALTIVVAASTDQRALTGTKLYVDGQEMRMGTMRWTPKTGPQVKMDFRWSAGEKKADYESKTETA